jgi:hypothetical protein
MIAAAAAIEVAKNLQSKKIQKRYIDQTALQERLEEFNEAFLSASENMKQLHLLMKMASPLVENGNKTEAF